MMMIYNILSTAYTRIYSSFINITKYIFFNHTYINNNVDAFSNLDKWYNHTYLLNDVHQHIHTKMQLWCLTQRLLEINNDDVSDSNKQEFEIINDIYNQINKSNPEIIIEINLIQ